MEATTPELSPVRFWSPKSSSFSGSDSIVVELSPRPSVNKSGAPKKFVQHDKVEDSKLRRYLETFGCALEQFLQRRTSSTTPLSSYWRMMQLPNGWLRLAMEMDKERKARLEKMLATSTAHVSHD